MAVVTKPPFARASKPETFAENRVRGMFGRTSEFGVLNRALGVANGTKEAAGYEAITQAFVELGQMRA